VTVRAHELAAGDLGLDAFQAVTLPDEPADLHGLRADVIKLEDGGIRQAAVGARAGAQDLEDVLSGGRTPDVACSPTLLPVKVAASPHICLAALLASRLPAVEVGGAENPHALRADLGGFQPDGDGWLRHGRSWRLNVASPHTDRRERHAEFAADLAERHAFGAEAP
jgi:hypothetical protein